MDGALIPGVLVCNRKIQSSRPALYDLGPTILKEFGVPIPEGMVGSPVV